MYESKLRAYAVRELQAAVKALQDNRHDIEAAVPRLGEVEERREMARNALLDACITGAAPLRLLPLHRESRKRYARQEGLRGQFGGILGDFVISPPVLDWLGGAVLESDRTEQAARRNTMERLRTRHAQIDQIRMFGSPSATLQEMEMAGLSRDRCIPLIQSIVR